MVLRLATWAADQIYGTSLTDLFFQGGLPFGAVLGNILKNLTGGEDFPPMGREEVGFVSEVQAFLHCS